MLSSNLSLNPTLPTQACRCEPQSNVRLLSKRPICIRKQLGIATQYHIQNTLSVYPPNRPRKNSAYKSYYSNNEVLKSVALFVSRDIFKKEVT